MTGIIAAIKARPDKALDGIKDYLTAGGMFNPELMDHAAVRDLIIECHVALEASLAAITKVEDERDELAEEVARFNEHRGSKQLLERALKAEQERDALKEALRPFADALKSRDEANAEVNAVVGFNMFAEPTSVSADVEHFHAARRALESKP